MTLQNAEKLWDLIKGMRTGMLTTEESGFLHARPMAILQKDFEDRSLYFLTSKRSGKIHEIAQNSDVCVSFADDKNSTYVSISGTAFLSENREKIRELWTPETSAFFEDENDPDIVLFKVRVERAEYWDVAESRMIQLYEFLKSHVTGHFPRLGENEKLDLT